MPKNVQTPSELLYALEQALDAFDKSYDDTAGGGDEEIQYREGAVKKLVKKILDEGPSSTWLKANGILDAHSFHSKQMWMYGKLKAKDPVVQLLGYEHEQWKKQKVTTSYDTIKMYIRLYQLLKELSSVIQEANVAGIRVWSKKMKEVVSIKADIDVIQGGGQVKEKSDAGLEIAEKTYHSAPDAYKPSDWKKIVNWLLENGYSPDVTEKLMKSEDVVGGVANDLEGFGGDKVSLDAFISSYEDWGRDYIKGKLVKDMSVNLGEVPEELREPMLKARLTAKKTPVD